MKEYWDNRYQDEGFIWGDKPSSTAQYATVLFLENHVQTVLVPGAGYGRNAKLLSDSFEVDAIELSPKAVLLARKMDNKTNYIEGSLFDLLPNDKKYNAIYCYDLLHLFTQLDRRRIIEACMGQLDRDGVYYFTCFSNEDAAFGIGEEIEENTFEYKKGKIAHFFTKEDLEDHFKNSEIIETGTINEYLEYSNRSTRVYKLRYIFGKKR